MYVIECPYLDLNKVFASGQSMRTRRMSDGKYLVLDGNRYCKVIQQKERLVFDCPEDDFYQYWFNYFDMQVPYDQIHYKIQAYADEQLLLQVNRAKGVRLLRQDPFEVVVNAILCHGKTQYYGAIAVDQFVRAFGQKHTRSMAESGKVAWYSFPTPESIDGNVGSLSYMDLDVEKQAAIIAASHLEAEGIFKVLRQKSPEYVYGVIQDEICRGKLGLDVGLKVLVYGYGNMDVLPVFDEVVNAYLIGAYGEKDLIDISEKHFPQLQPVIGLVYQYILWNQLNPPIEKYYDWQRR